MLAETQNSTKVQKLSDVLKHKGSSVLLCATLSVTLNLFQGLWSCRAVGAGGTHEMLKQVQHDHVVFITVSIKLKLNDSTLSLTRYDNHHDGIH